MKKRFHPMAQKNFFAIITIVACLLAFAPAELMLFLRMHDYISGSHFLIAGGFGIAAGIFMIVCFYKHIKMAALMGAVLSCIAAASFGLGVFSAVVGTAVLLVLAFALFVIAIIHYEDIGELRR
jgi:hypothetical protein